MNIQFDNHFYESSEEQIQNFDKNSEELLKLIASSKFLEDEYKL